MINTAFAPRSYKRADLEDSAFYKKVGKYIVNYVMDKKTSIVVVKLRYKEVSYPRNKIVVMINDLGPTLAARMLAANLKKFDEE
jgi:hypothetical protein